QLHGSPLNIRRVVSRICGALFRGSLVHTNKFVLRSMLLAGFLIGSLPIALLANTLLRSDWADDIRLVFNAGALGIIGSTAFYFTFKGIISNNSFKPKPPRGSG
ncbi:hypothetical protein VC253_21840, partial [Xanthomonas campestris]